MIDFKNERQVKDFMLETLIKKEWLQDQIAVLNEEVKAEKKSSNRWLNLYLEAYEKNASLKEELEQIKSSNTQAQESEEGHEEGSL